MKKGGPPMPSPRPSEIIAHMMLEFTDLQIDSEESLVIQRYLSSLLN